MHYTITVPIQMLADRMKHVFLKVFQAASKMDEKFHILFTLNTPSLPTKNLIRKPLR